jgi:hypothetical protein
MKTTKVNRPSTQAVRKVCAVNDSLWLSLRHVETVVAKDPLRVGFQQSKLDFLIALKAFSKVIGINPRQGRVQALPTQVVHARIYLH